MSIIDRLSQSYQRTNNDLKKLKTLGKVSALALFLVPPFVAAKLKVDNLSEKIDQGVVKRIMNSSESQEYMDNVLRPYFRDHPGHIQFAPETYDSLQRIQSLLPEEKVQSKAHEPELVDTNTVIKMDGQYRVEIGTNIYFSQVPLQSAEFIPEWNMVYDSKARSLYSIDTEKQRLDNVINEVHYFIRTGGEQYAIQGRAVFKKENGKIFKVYGGKDWCNVQQIHGTPYNVFLGGDKPFILGKIKPEEKDFVASLEERLSKYNFVPDSTTKIRYCNDKLYLGTEKRVVVIGNSVKVIKPEGEGAKIVDYIPVPSSYEPRTLLISQYIPNDEEPKREVMLRHESGAVYRTFPSDQNTPKRFPIDVQEYRFDWIDPSNLKNKVYQHFQNEKLKEGGK